MWVSWNIFLEAYVNKDNLNAFQSEFFLWRSTLMSNGLFWWDSSTFKRKDSIKTCVAVFIFSRKISGLLSSLSVGTLICRASMIKHLLFISSFTPLYNSARRVKSRMWKINSGRYSSSPNHRSQNHERNQKVGQEYCTGINRTKVKVRDRLTHLHRGLSRVDCELLYMKSSW